MTGRDGNNPTDQVKRLETIQDSLQKISKKSNKDQVRLFIEYSDSLHDREIR